MKICSDDGMEFNSTKECEEYERKLILKKQKEEEERKAKEETRESKWNQVMNKLEELNNAIGSYEKDTTDELSYSIDNEKLQIERYKQNYGTWGRLFRF